MVKRYPSGIDSRIKKEGTDEKINRKLRKMSIFILTYDKNNITIYPKYNHNFTISSIAHG